MDRRVFFDRIRPSLFKGGLKQGQVDGINAVLDEWEKRALTDLRWLAYMLATDYHETARTMQAIEEWGKGKGKAYGKKDPKTGKAYYGRGLVQLTWAANYKKMGKALGLPLYENPELALRPDIAVQILFEGMTEAKSTVCDFTGKCLSDYFTASKTDWVGARRIINGTDRAAMVAGYARKFHDALVAAAEPFKSPEALKRSRIVKSASGAAVGGASTAGFNGVGLYDAATKAEGHVSTGSLVGMAIGAAVMCFALYALYARWDDAGRPSLRQVFRGFDAEPEE